MSNYYNILVPRQYTNKDGEEKTAFTKIGTAWPMKGKEGFSLTFDALPVPSINSKTNKLECKALLMLPLEDREDKPVRPKTLDEATGGDAVPF